MGFKTGYEHCEGSPPKSLGHIVLWIYSAVLLILIIFIGFFALKSEVEGPQEVFYPPIPCSYNEEKPQISWMSKGYCPPAINIFFLKTHKCASSTVQSILMRFGDKRNLSFVLPTNANYIGYPERFSKTMVSSGSPQLGNYNILCHHLRLDMNAVRDVLPGNTVSITIVRDPVSLFRSMYDYYNMTYYFKSTLNNFVKDGKSMADLSQNRFYEKMGMNQMLFDLGYDSSIFDNLTLIQNAIDETDRDFDLVMVSELFDESLILLKHKLCWSMEDIVYLVHNKRTHDEVEVDNSYVNSIIRDYNSADQILYDYFYNRLNDTIEAFGRDRMAEEVQELRLWNKLWFDHCVKQMSSTNTTVPSETKAYNSKVYSFVLNDKPIANICEGLAMEELQYTQKLRLKQKHTR